MSEESEKKKEDVDKEKEKEKEAVDTMDKENDNDPGGENQSRFQIKGEIVPIELKNNKNTYNFEFGAENTVLEMKKFIESYSNIPIKNQKLMFRGAMKDELTLKASGLKSTSSNKIMLIGSPPELIENVQKNAAKSLAPTVWFPESKEVVKKWYELPKHARPLASGPPEGAITPILGEKRLLPADKQITHLLNSECEVVRVRFLKAQGVINISSTKYTEVIAYGSIVNVSSQPMQDYPGYHMMCLTAARSTQYLYYVPEQFVEAIKDDILGKFVYY